MQAARMALSAALRICPRTAVSTYTRPATVSSLRHRQQDYSLRINSVSWDYFAFAADREALERLVSVDGFSVFSKCRPNRRGGGVAVYVRNSLPSSLLDISVPDEIECLWVRVRPYRLPRNVSSLAICAVYSPPNSAHEEWLANPRATLDLLITNLTSYCSPPTVSPPLGTSDHNLVNFQPKARRMINRMVKRVHRPMKDSSLRSFGQWIASYDWPEVFTANTACLALVHTSSPPPSGSKQNCLRPDMPHRTDHGTWSGLDLGLFIGAGLLVTAGLFEQKRTQQTTHTPSDVLVPPLHYVPSDVSQYTGLNLVPKAPQTSAGVLFRSAIISLEKNDKADRNVAGSEATAGNQKDQRAFEFPRDVSDETPTAVGPVKMHDKALSTVEDVREAPARSKKTSGDAIDGGDTKEVLDDAVNERGERSSTGKTVRIIQSICGGVPVV
ncbi:Hypp4602 [Branchiostoma lanceolatum]|uniref:Hypp4602 protein n=1 Tax=Branchiostoma lanceolatum TaxID=7740 RepID=A0A8K0AB44_BRALA|nr:Hypp4602 [Branchiostoma lanceolatum]